MIDKRNEKVNDKVW